MVIWPSLTKFFFYQLFWNVCWAPSVMIYLTHLSFIAWHYISRSFWSQALFLLQRWIHVVSLTDTEDYGGPQGTCRFVITGSFPTSNLRTRNFSFRKSKFWVWKLEISSLQTRNYGFRKISRFETRNNEFANSKFQVSKLKISSI